MYLLQSIYSFLNLYYIFFYLKIYIFQLGLHTLVTQTMIYQNIRETLAILKNSLHRRENKEEIRVTARDV